MTLDRPDNPGGDPFAPDLLPDRTLEGRLRALGLGEHDPHGPTREAGPADLERSDNHGVPDPRFTALGAQLATLSSGLATHRVQLRDAERSLVDRIADVDDDRRRGQGQLQRALQAQREELESRIRRQGWFMALSLLVIAILAGLALYLIHERLASGQGRLAKAQAPLAAEVRSLRDEVTRLSGVESQGALVQDKLDALSSAVGALSSSLGEVAARPTPATQAASPEIPALLEQIGRLEAEQQRLRDALGALHAQAPAPSGPEPAAPDSQSPSRPPEAAGREDVPTGTAPGGEPESPSEPPGGPGPAAPAPDAATVPAGPGTASTASTGSATVASDARTKTVDDQPYALQLIGFFSLDKLRNFAAKQDLPPEIYLRKETVRGRPWFVLIHSLYPSYEDAEAALKRLPPRLAAIDPLIRRLPAGTDLVTVPTGPAR